MTQDNFKMGLVFKKPQTPIWRVQISPPLTPAPLRTGEGTESEINHQWQIIQPICLFSEPWKEVHNYWVQRACRMVDIGRCCESTVLTRAWGLGTPPLPLCPPCLLPCVEWLRTSWLASELRRILSTQPAESVVTPWIYCWAPSGCLGIGFYW